MSKVEKKKSLGDLLPENIFEKWIKDIAGDKPPARLLRMSDPRLRERAGLIYRGLGFIICIVVFYFSIFGVFQENLGSIWLWLGIYLAYLVGLELVRVRKKEWFDNQRFRIVRIVINILAITWLISIPSTILSILGLFYTVPIFASIIYFPDNRKAISLTIFLSLIGLIVGGIFLSHPYALSYVQFIFILIVLSFFSYAFYWFHNNIIFGSDLISRVAIQLHKTLDVQELANYIVGIAIRLTRADRSLLIIVDPNYRGYVKHAEIGFELKTGFSIEHVAEKCSVIESGTPFNCPDMAKHYNNRDIYSSFFTCQPKSVLATPLFNRVGGVIGVLTVASDTAYRFDSTTNDLMNGFSYLVSSAVENSLIHRQLKLREIRTRAITQDFARARDEREIFNLILHETKEILPNANCVMHKLETSSNLNYSLKESILVPWMWDADNYNQTDNSISASPTKFRYGSGLAGHAIKLHEPILANDAGKHPWFVKFKPDDDAIQSILVCPLYDPNGKVDYGTISVYCDHLNAFTQEDEFVVSSLAHQASLAISKIKELEEWQEQGGVLRKILNEVRYFDFGVSEYEFCNQIAQAATKLLNFKMARIRLLDTKNEELITVAMSGFSEEITKKLIGHTMPFSTLEPFINNQYQLERSFIIPHGDRRWKDIATKYFYIPPAQKRVKTEWKPYDAILTPLIAPSGQTIGLLTLDMPKDGTYPTKSLIKPIGLYASMVAWAIELSRYQRRFLDQRDRTKSFIETISDELTQGHDFQTLGEVVVQIGAKLISAEGCNLFIVRENEIELTHSTYLAGTDYIGRRKPICSDPGCGLTGWVSKTGKVLLYNGEEYKNHPSWAGEAGHLNYLSSQACKSVLLVPILDVDDKVLGVLSLENKRRFSDPADFDEEDKVRVIKLAEQLAKALIRIGRFEAIKKWESKGLEDDLHFLINWYRFGVLARIEQLEGAIYKDDLVKAKQLMPELIRNARNSVNELKALHTMIINECLEANDLKEGMERLIDAWNKRVVPVYKENLPMQIILSCPSNLEIEVALRNTILRIASEALSNSIFHSGIIESPKTQVKIEIKASSKKITLRISDNGVGVKTLREGVGIDRMNQLTKQVNSWGGIIAKLVIKSQLQKGTRVVFSASYKN